LAISAQATDDVAVAAVIFNVNGIDVSTDTTAPYEATYTVQEDAVNLTISADAVDIGSNISSSAVVNITAIPDPLTTGVGRVVDSDGMALAGAQVTCLGVQASTNFDGFFSVPGLPTIQGGLRCAASFNDGIQFLRGISSAVAPVKGASTDVGNIIVLEGPNQGRDFWLAYQKVSSPGARITIISEVDANFTITASNFSYTGSVSPQSFAEVPIPKSLQITANQAIENKGIHITSDADVTALLFLYAGGTADIALAIPNNALGAEYIAVGYQETLSARGYSGGHSEFVIVSNKNDTHVTLIPSCTSIGGTAAGSVLNIVLNQGQTYQYLCDNRTDVTGTKITSDKPVGVISGNACADIPLGVKYCDVLSEMMFPVNTLFGTEFFSAPLPGNSSDVFRITAAYNGTVVTVDQGSIQNSYQLDAAQFKELQIEPGAHFTSTKPISVTQYAVGSGQAGMGDPFQMQLIPVNAYKNTFKFYIPSDFSPSYAIITATNAAVLSTTLNGLPVTGFQALPGGTHQYVLVPVQWGQNFVTSNQPIAVYGIGYGALMSYGYPAGF
jgi:hypothetical protein